MIHRSLEIGKWLVDILFADDGYDVEEVLSLLYEREAPYDTMLVARDIMEDGSNNKGFTYSNPEHKYAVVVIGPASSGAEFIDTLVHEMLHVAIEISVGEEANLRGETPAYIIGDSARDLSDVICYLGCVPNSTL